MFSVHVLTSGVFTFTKLYTMYGFLIFSIQLFQLLQSEEELKDTRMYFQTKKVKVDRYTISKLPKTIILWNLLIKNLDSCWNENENK